METFDYQDQFERIKKETVDALTKGLNVDGKYRQIRVSNVWVDDKLDSGDWESQRQAVRSDKTWGVPVYASLELLDKQTGKVLSQANKLKVATIPKGTELGSFIVNGKHYQVHNQLRRKPGVYVTERANHQLRTDINIPGKPFGIDLDQKLGVFRLIKGQGDTLLYPLLSRMGISDSALSKAWGQDLLESNKAFQARRHATAVKKAGQYFMGQAYESAEAAAKDVQDFLQKSRLAPEVTNKTLGQAFDHVTPEVLLRGSEELLKVSRGERQPDDRQSIEYKKIMSVSDFIKERLVGELGGFAPKLTEFRRKITARLNNRGNLPNQIGRVVNTDQFTPLFDTFFTGTDLAHTPDQTNPLHILNGLSKVTIAGEGGVQEEHSIKEEERAVHHSHLGFLDPIHTPESQTIGIITQLPVGAVKGANNEIKTRVHDIRSGTSRFVSPLEMRDLVLTFPDQIKNGKPIAKQVRAMINGELKYVDAGKVDVYLSDPKQAFSISTNSIPFLPSAQAVRTLMATKMLEQALPLEHREEPLVQVGFGKKTLEGHVGDGFVIKAKADGVIEKVTPTRIHIKTKEGVIEQPIFNNLPLNKKSFLHASPVVSVGDKVKEGDLLADSNFTRNGKLALGTNLRAAYIPFKGYNFEDGIVITEGAAKKLTSQHMYQFAEDLSKNVDLSTHQYAAWKPGDLNLEQKGKLDEAGVIRKGQTVKKGDPLWVGVTESLTDPDSIIMSKLAKLPPKKAFKQIWDNEADGEVIDVVRSGSKVKVYVKTLEPAQIGDKLTSRHGAKGIITKIISDGESPQNAAGLPVEILLNPHGIVTRMNPSQILETAAAKIADKTGKTYVVHNFDGENYAEKINKELAHAGVSDEEQLFDPHTKKPLGTGTMVGPQYILKLTKQAVSQFSARSDGAYDINRAPLKGGDDGAKAVDLMAMYAMLAHGARANIREMATYKATKNDQFWQWLQSGPAIGLLKPPPEPTFAYKKFEGYLKGAGVNMERKGSKMILGPMTDREVGKLSSGAVKEPLFMRGKDLQHVKTGLMDPVIFGQREDRWGHFDLAEPIPNPVFEKPIKQLTGMDTSQFDGLVKGNLYYDPDTGKWNAEQQGLTGGNAIKALLSKIDVAHEIKGWTEKAKTSNSPAKLDTANKQLKYLHALSKLKLLPADAYIQTKLPILPPQFRPITPLPDGSLAVSGVNNLYRDIGLINKELAWQNSVPYIPESMKTELREHLYRGAQAVAGLGDPIAYYQPQRRPKGFIDQIRGEAAKTGFFQQEVLKRKQNLVGRGTIIPDPKLGTDEVGLPEEMAWSIFRPFIVRQLVSLGKNPNEALDDVDKRTPTARSALDAVMSDRPVLLNRAPTLHKFGVLAFKPRIVDGSAIKIPPLIVKGFNADFDGDAMTVHVPLLPDAVKEAKGMYPSRHLYNPGTGQVVIQPQNEAALGLYFLSKHPELKDKILEQLPEQLQKKYLNVHMDKKGLTSLINDLAKDEPNRFGKIVDRLKNAGDQHVYDIGFTTSMKDLSPVLPERDKILADADQKVRHLYHGKESPTTHAEAVAIIQHANTGIENLVRDKIPNNRFHQMVSSGARGKSEQLQQIIAGPVITDDYRGEPIPMPITKGFAHGLPFSEYWQTTYGARRVAMDKQLQTERPGAFSKDLMATVGDNVISTPDCKTSQGISLSVSAQGKDVEDRFLTMDIKIGAKSVARAGDLVTQNLLSLLRERNVKEVSVRSPLTCKAPHGTCAKCYGVHDDGQLPAIGENIGVISGQALSEPLTQMTMRTFHSGGASGTRNVISGFEKIDKMFKMPEILPNKATLATKTGKVTKVESATGRVGHNVFIRGTGEHEDTKHYVGPGLLQSDKIKQGTMVTRGDSISLGLIKPKELVELKGMLPAQSYIVDQVKDAYKSQGVNLKRRTIETVMRSVGNTTKVLDPGDSNYLYGDIAQHTVVEHFNHSSLGRKAPKDAIGHVLREKVGHYPMGTLVDEHIAKALDRMDKKDVEVGPRPVVHQPFLSGIARVPLMRDDWMAQLGYHRLKDAIVTGAAQAKESNIHGYSPIPAFAYGAEFGIGPDGKY